MSTATLNTAKENTRYVGIDSLRGWLIVLVILGHVVLGSVYDNLIRYSIYAFHMPVFIGLTGYLINADTLRQSSFVKIFMRYWWRVLFPFAFAYLFFTGILAFHAFEEGRLNSQLLLSYMLTPYYHLWFVPTMVLWVLAFSAVLKLRIPLLLVLLFFSLLSLLWAAIPGAEQWPFLAPLLSKKVVYFFSFFVFGAWLRTSGSNRFKALFSQFKVLPITLVVACAGLYLINIDTDKTLFTALVWGVLNAALIVVLIDGAISKSRAKSSIISDIGRNSLPIYLWHVVPLFILKGFDVHQAYTLIYYFVASISMVLIVLAILRLEGRSKWLNRCLFGAV